MTGPAFPSAATDLMRITVRDVNENPVGQLSDWMEADVIPRWNGIGSFHLKIALGTPDAWLFKAGGSVIVLLPEGQTFTGQFTNLRKIKEPGAPFGVLEVSGVEDNAILGFRQCWPSPLEAITNQTATATYNATGPAETVARDLVRLNIGPGARPERGVVGIQLDPDQGQGGTVSVCLRYDILLGAIQRILSPMGLSFSVKAELTGGYRFSITKAKDLTQSLKFSERLNNLNGFDYGLRSPGLTQAIVAGQGEGTARNMKSFPEPTGLLESTWGWRIEQFLDRRDTNVLQELQQAATEAFFQQNNQFSLSIDPLDTPDRRFGVHYHLGDEVSVEIDDETYVDRITAARYSSKPGEFRISPVIGNAEAVGGRALEIYRVVRLIATRVGLLEKRF